MTAGHCLSDVEGKDKTFILQNDVIGVHFAKVIGAVVHPLFKIRELGKCPAHDIGIALVGPPVSSSLPPSPLYEKDSSLQELLGQILRTVGYGVTGRGDINILFRDAEKRLAENPISDRKDEDGGQRLIVTFNNEQPSTRLNGFPEGGDCGAPGFLRTPEGEKLVALFHCAARFSKTGAMRKFIEFKGGETLLESEKIPLDLSLHEFAESSPELKDSLLMQLRDQL